MEHQEDATQLAFELAKAKEEFSELHTDGRDKTLELQAEVQRLSQLTQPGVREDKAVQVRACLKFAFFCEMQDGFVCCAVNEGSTQTKWL